MKMYCIFSKESIAKMGGNRGKLAAQAGHAFLHAFWNAESNYPTVAYFYQTSGLAKKVTLVCETDKELEEIYNAYAFNTGATKVVDQGLTVFNEPTLTCIGIGPIAEDLVGSDIKSLKVLI